MKKRVFLFSMVAIFMLGVQNIQAKKKISMTKTELLNKIKGGWAAQTIGCTYGGPTEFVYQSHIQKNLLKDIIKPCMTQGYKSDYLSFRLSLEERMQVAIRIDRFHFIALQQGKDCLWFISRM